MFDFLGIELSKISLDIVLMGVVYYFYFGYSAMGSLYAGLEQGAAVLIVDSMIADTLSGSIAQLRNAGLNVVEAVIFGGIRMFFHGSINFANFIRPAIASLLVSFASCAINKGLHSSMVIGSDAAAEWKRKQQFKKMGAVAPEPSAAEVHNIASNNESKAW